MPQHIRSRDKDPRPIRSVRLNVKLRHLRLVHPVTDPATGKTKDVVFESMDLRPRLIECDVVDEDECAFIASGTTPLVRVGEDRNGNEITKRIRKSLTHYRLPGYKWKTFRYVPGTNQEIRSFEADEEEPDRPYNPGDTLAVEVEWQSFEPSLHTPPMPSSVIDELRNKYSRLRKRHPEEHWQAVRQKAELETKAEIKKELRMVTPLDEIKVKLKRVERRSKSKMKPNNDQLMVALGQAMAKNLSVTEKEPKSRKKLLDRIAYLERRSVPAEGARAMA